MASEHNGFLALFCLTLLFLATNGLSDPTQTRSSASQASWILINPLFEEFDYLIRNPPSCLNSSEFRNLVETSDMLARTATQLLAVPFQVFSSYFLQPNLFPTWNTDYTQVNTTSYQVCAPLHATFTTKINVTNPPGSTFQTPQLIAVFQERTKVIVGWQFWVKNGEQTVDYGTHFYSMEEVLVGKLPATLYVSWEKISGGIVAQNKAAFEVGLGGTVLLPDWVGANCLERQYLLTGKLDPVQISSVCPFYCST